MSLLSRGRQLPNLIAECKQFKLAKEKETGLVILIHLKTRLSSKNRWMAIRFSYTKLCIYLPSFFGAYVSIK